MRFRSVSRGLLIAPAVGLLALVGLACNGSGPAGSAPGTRPGSGIGNTTEVAAPPDDQIRAGQVVYVPVYSHVETGDNRQPLNLAATVFVRNTDAAHAIIVTRVRFFDSAGQRLREELVKPRKIAPMASIDFFVKESDISGGAAPSFLVEWVATEAVSDPVIESVMIGTSGTQGISLTGVGRVIRSRKP